MKTKLLAVMIMASTSATAATLHAPDKAFIDKAYSMNVLQENWDSGRSAKLTFKNAYKFTSSVELEKGGWSWDMGKAKGFDLDAPIAQDVDGDFPVSVILRDRLNMESLVLMKNGRLIDEYYWSGMNKDQTHLMMSVTKSFTSILLRTLVDEGLVNMQDPITKYLPELKASEGFRDATVQEVADMRSGIKIEFTPGKIWDERMTNVQEWNGVNNYPELKSVLDFGKTLGQRADVRTGQAFDYQCANTEMLGMLISRVTGKSAAEVLEERIWKRVGFEHNAFIQSNHNGEAVMSGGLNATTRDAALMMDVLVNGGKNRKGEQIVSKEFIDKLMAGNDEVKSAWQYDGFAALLSTAWYKDQIRVLTVGEHQFLTFVGIHGQVIVGEPSTGIVVAMNGAQDEMQAVRTVSMTFLSAVPSLLDALADERY